MTVTEAIGRIKGLYERCETAEPEDKIAVAIIVNAFKDQENIASIFEDFFKRGYQSGYAQGLLDKENMDD